MKNIDVETMDNYSIIHLSGQFTGGAETDELVNEFDKVTNLKNPRLIVDFSNTSYMSSIVIGLLVKTHAKFNEADGTLILCSLNTTLRNVLKMTKVDTVLYIVDSLEQAKEKIEF